MYKALAAGLMSCAVMASFAAQAQTPEPMEDLAAFLADVQVGELRVPQHYSAEFPEVVSHNERRRVAPRLEIVAGRLDAEACLYQLRLELNWSGKALAHDDATVGGRSLIQKAPCASLAQEVMAVAGYELSALTRRLREGGRLASNQERDQIVAAARRVPMAESGSQDLLAAVTVESRVNLRASPSLKSPVLAKLAPASLVHVRPTTADQWYQLQGRPGYVHASALQSVHPAEPLAPPAAVEADLSDLVYAEVGTAHVPLREEPSLSGRVVGRVRPGTQLRLLPATEPDWFELEDGSGFVPKAALQRILPAERLLGARAGSQVVSIH